MNAILCVLDKSDIVHSIGDCRRNSKLSTLSLSRFTSPSISASPFLSMFCFLGFYAHLSQSCIYLLLIIIAR